MKVYGILRFLIVINRPCWKAEIFYLFRIGKKIFSYPLNQARCIFSYASKMRSICIGDLPFIYKAYNAIMTKEKARVKRTTLTTESKNFDKFLVKGLTIPPTRVKNVKILK